MMKWNNLQEILKPHGTKAKLSKATGISTGNISDWFNPGKNAQPSAEALIKIADYFDCSVDYLLDRTDIKYLAKKSTNIIQIPILPQSAAAGFGKEASEDQIYEASKIQWFYQEQIPKEAEYGIIIEGDSMEPKFHNGQTIFVKLSSDCSDGQYGIFKITNGYETKVYFKQKQMINYNTYRLHSLNSKYKDIVDFENKTCKCIAVAVF